ncbi:MAG: glycosyltransferase [Muribaculum sp.]|nr:glycosyltransferase [Muribaculum sp.]
MDYSIDYGLVSIIMPSYNGEKYIKETIDSVINQSYKNWELLITDDSSTDNTVDIIQEYAKEDPRIKIFCFKENSGAAVARNNSINNASGKYIAMLDSDDLWFPEKLERQLTFMNSNGYEMSHASVLTCTEDGKINGINVAYHKVGIQQIVNCDKVNAATVMYDTTRVGKIFMPNIRKRQDWGWKIMLIKAIGYSYGMREALGIYRMRSNSLSRKKSELIKYNIGIYEIVLKMSYWHAVWKFVCGFIPAYVLKMIRKKLVNQ